MGSRDVVVTMVAVGLALMVGACDKDTSLGAASAPSGAHSGATAPPESARAEPTPLEIIESKRTFADAVAYARTQMTDTDDEASPGGVLLAMWGAKHMTWADVGVAKSETSYALVRKDSDAHRGKRVCIRGSLIQIQKEDAGNGTHVFTGLMMTGYSEITNFIAVGSTGELVARSKARFCGVVIGTYDYSNSGGGKGHAVTLVGMFDLPENRGQGE